MAYEIRAYKEPGGQSEESANKSFAKVSPGSSFFLSLVLSN